MVKIINDGIEPKVGKKKTFREMSFQSKFAAALIKLIRRKATKGREQEVMAQNEKLTKTKTKLSSMRRIFSDNNDFILLNKSKPPSSA